jgi:hypothetical protein
MVEAFEGLISVLHLQVMAEAGWGESQVSCQARGQAAKLDPAQAGNRI